MESPMTLEEAKTLKFRVSVKGVGFDVPVNYHYQDYALVKGHWPRPPHDQVAGWARPEVDSIEITAMLPDLAPYTEENAAQFEVLGWGDRVRASLTHRLPNWNYYFDNFAYRLERRPDSPDVPGMLHYHDSVTKDTVFFSHDHAVPDLIRIDCASMRDSKDFNPSCKVHTLYRGRFYLSYSFARPYLAQWLEIDSKLKALYDQFTQAAKQQP